MSARTYDSKASWAALVHDLLELQLEADFSRPQMHGFATVYEYDAGTGFITCHLLHREGHRLSSGPVDSNYGETIGLAQAVALAFVLGGVDD